MVKIQFLLIFLLLSSVTRSQEDIYIGKKQTLYSAALQEGQGYWINLPENYDQDKAQTYPVIYLLDGDSFFHALVGISKAFSSGRGKYFPPSIIIGVSSTDRTRDFTPTASAAGRGGKVSPGTTLEGGGSETFSRFLTEEHGVVRYLYSYRS